MSLIGRTLCSLGLACLTGGMVFFSAVVAPLVFIKLPPDVAGPFIRAAFPCYDWFVIASAAIGAIGFLLRRRTAPAIVLLLIIAVTLCLLFWLIPHLNAWRAAGDKAAFGKGHTLSVWINGAELLVACWLLMQDAIWYRHGDRRTTTSVPD